MSAKPNIALSRFADTVSADVVDPPSGIRDTGFVDNTPAEVGFVNALFFRNYEWDKWLDDGDVAFHDLSATGTLGVTGQTTLGAKLTVSAGGIDLNGGLSVLSGGVSVATGQAVALNGTTTLTVGTGAVTLGGTLGVTGNTTVGGNLTVSGHVKTVDPITFSIGFAAPAGGAVLDSGTGILGLGLGTSTVPQALPLQLPVGFVIAGWQIKLNKTSASGTITAKLIDQNGFSGTPGASDTNSANNPGAITLSKTGLSVTVQAGHAYYLELTGGGVTGDFAWSYQVTPG